MGNRRKRNRWRNRGGFSLIEIMAVVVIIGILGTAVGIVVTNRIARARVTTTKSTIRTVGDAVRQFKFDTGQYPKKLEDLVEKPTNVPDSEWGGPYLRNYPLDGWENPLIYKRRSQGDLDFLIKSLGADNSQGGTDENKDISNRTMREARKKKRRRQR